jgi:asparagine synthase (glutamine-hydrolysing)
MCGIAGILDFVALPSARELMPMVNIQRHRGPDGEGALVDGPLAMGMRRLSIIDLSGGDQPIWNEDGTVAVVLNGEIYNYVELRTELLALGHRFATKSDTEVLVHAYEEWDEGLLPRLNGMFAFAVWNGRRRRLLLARDRLGVKPLYLARFGSRLCFASSRCCSSAAAWMTD